MNAKLEDLRISHKQSSNNRELIFPLKTLFSMLTIAVFSITLGIFGWRTLSKKTPQLKGIETVTVFPSQEQPSAIILTAGGYIEPAKKITISSKRQGIIKLLGVNEGTQVKAGDIIAKLEDTELRAQVNQAKANLLISQARVREIKSRLTNAELNLTRTKKLYNENVVTKQDLEGAQVQCEIISAQHQSAKAQILQAKTGLELARSQLSEATLKTPISGTVAKKFIRQGEIVNPLTPGIGGAVVTVTNLNELRVWVEINENDISKVRVGQIVEISPNAALERSYKGKIIKIMPEADRQKNSVEVKIEIINPDEFLKPDMSVKIAILEKSSSESRGGISELK